MTEWFIAKDGKKHGPVSTAQLKQLAASGEILPTDTVWREGLEGWAKASMLKGVVFAGTPGFHQDVTGERELPTQHTAKRSSSESHLSGQHEPSYKPNKPKRMAVKLWKKDLLLLLGVLGGFLLLVAVCAAVSNAFFAGNVAGYLLLASLPLIFCVRPYTKSMYGDLGIGVYRPIVDGLIASAFVFLICTGVALFISMQKNKEPVYQFPQSKGRVDSQFYGTKDQTKQNPWQEKISARKKTPAEHTIAIDKKTLREYEGPFRKTVEAVEADESKATLPKPAIPPRSPLSQDGRKTFSTKGLPKAKGVNLTFSYPKEWKKQETKLPNCFMEFNHISQDKRWFTTFQPGIDKFPVDAIRTGADKKYIDLLSREMRAGQTIEIPTRTGVRKMKILKIEKTTIAGLPACMIESEVKPQGGGEKETTYNVQYIFVYKGNLVILQGMLFRYNLKADVTEKEKAHQREVHWLICTRIANSVTISKE